MSTNLYCCGNTSVEEVAFKRASHFERFRSPVSTLAAAEGGGGAGRVVLLNMPSTTS